MLREVVEPVRLRVSDAELATLLAEEAGRRLVRLRSEGGRAQDDVRRRGDADSHTFLADALARYRPGDAVLSEEGADDLARLACERVWIVDPLDGTREFGEPGRPDWAVHVALWERGALAAGAVALPAVPLTLSSDRPPALPPLEGPRRILVSRTRPPEFVEALAARLDATVTPMGSAGAKTASVLRGAAVAYVHAGGQYEWDTAAPVAVARAAGLHTCRLDGSPLQYNRANPWQPDVVIARPEVAEPLLAALAELVPAPEGSADGGGPR